MTDAQPDEETQALVASIAEHGQRTPAEVVPLPEGRFGLVSGWRRLQALRALHAHTGDAKFATLRAVVRARDETGLPDPAAYVAMVEENEVRLGLTPYERGRVAVRAVEAGAFDDVAEAVEALFAAGSKTRRHKIRKCARLAEELGEALDPLGPRLTERAALKLAEALDKGGAAALAGALAMTEGQGAEARLTALSRAADAAIHGTARAAPALRGAGRIAGRLPLTAGLELVEREGREGPVFELKGPDAALPGVADLARAVLLTAEWPKSLPGSAQGSAQGAAQGSGPGSAQGSRSARDATPPEE
ncbi:MAG: ParB N-terminal domain-containing protein [Pseudomonadota bacterium]